MLAREPTFSRLAVKEKSAMEAHEHALRTELPLIAHPHVIETERLLTVADTARLVRGQAPHAPFSKRRPTLRNRLAALSPR